MKNIESYVQNKCKLIQRKTHYLENNGLNGKLIVVDILPFTGDVYRDSNEQIRLAFESAQDAYSATDGCTACLIKDKCKPRPMTVQEKGNSWKIYPALLTAFPK